MLKSLFLKVENPDVERAISMTVVNRLLVSGSDRFCERWRRDYFLPGCKHLELHHLYRAMVFLGEALSGQADAAPFTRGEPRTGSKSCSLPETATCSAN
jgi:hypothetical protein